MGWWRRCYLNGNRNNGDQRSRSCEWCLSYSRNRIRWKRLPNDSIHFRVSGVKTGDYLVRIMVDGAESLLTGDEEGKYAAPRLTLRGRESD